MSKGKGQEECENIKGVIRSHHSKKGRQYNVQRKRTNSDLQHITQKTNDCSTRNLRKETRIMPGAPER